MSRIHKLVFGLVLLALLAGAFGVIFGHAVLKGYFRDENQFVASGKLLAEDGLLPYRDYPYFHMPNLVFIYALIYRLTDFTLLGARLFSVLCAWGTVALLFAAALLAMRRRSPWVRLAAGCAAALLLISNPLFRFTTGLAWNHDFPVLMTMAAALVHLWGGRSPRFRLACLLSGLLVGLAAGARLTFGLAAGAFLLSYWLHPGLQTTNHRLRAAGIFLAGFGLAMLPSLGLFAAAPGQFIFGNLVYPGLNLQYRLDTGFDGPMSIGQKLAYLDERVLNQPGTQILIMLLLLFAVLPLIAVWMHTRQIPFEFGFLLTLPLFLLAGSFLPTPSWYQYFYAPLPLTILAALAAITWLDDLPVRLRNWPLALLVIGACLTTYLHADQYPGWKALLQPGRWYPIQVHVLGYRIQSLAGEGRVLTLSPQYPLDGNASIYPQLATGPFAWRVAEYLSPQERLEQNLAGPADLASLLADEPPAGLLTGLTRDSEDAILEFALQNGYNPTRVNEDLVLWLPK